VFSLKSAYKMDCKKHGAKDSSPKNSQEFHLRNVCGGGGKDRRWREIPWLFLYILLPNAMCIHTNKEKTRKPQAQQLRVLLKYASRGTKGT
jgi:hypothetical protein